MAPKRCIRLDNHKGSDNHPGSGVFSKNLDPLLVSEPEPVATAQNALDPQITKVATNAAPNGTGTFLLRNHFACRRIDHPIGNSPSRIKKHFSALRQTAISRSAVCKYGRHSLTTEYKPKLPPRRASNPERSGWNKMEQNGTLYARDPCPAFQTAQGEWR